MNIPPNHAGVHRPQPLRDPVPAPAPIRLEGAGASRAAAPCREDAPPPSPGKPDVSRPDSPTFRVLWENVRQGGKSGNTMAPTRAAGVKSANPEQAAAMELFRNNLEARDPTGKLRVDGEFLQTYGVEEGHVVAHCDMKYSRGESSSRSGSHRHPERDDLPGLDGDLLRILIPAGRR